MLEAAENRLLHGPTMRLRRAASERDSDPGLDELVVALRELFALDEEAELGYEEAEPMNVPRTSSGSR
jgi:hypothetical protein